MILRKDSWSHNEEEILANIVMQYAREEGTQTDAFRHAATFLPKRTVRSISQHWHKELKKRINPKLYDITTDNVVDIVPEVKQDENKDSVKNTLSIHELVLILNTQYVDETTVQLANKRLQEILAG